MNELEKFSTKELNDELIRRLGVQSIPISFEEKAKITVDNHERFNFDGPAVIIVNMD
jgi:hypothetical protein